MDAPYATYLTHLREGKLAYQYSAAGGQPVFFPRAVSPFDIDETLEWRVSGGLGSVYSTTVVHVRDKPSYNVALIDCDEGFRLMSRVEGCAPETIQIGMRVRLQVQPGSGEDEPIPVFLPVGATSPVTESSL
jgi:uncharacterized OB-fold protein